jgi:cobalt-zinc-cadmium efflux system membrane fusion protein
MRCFLQVFGLLAFVSTQSLAHEGHEHDKPPPLNLPVAPRVISVTPDFELVGVRSGNQRLTIFLHRFATGEPVADTKLHLTVGNDTRAAKSDGPGVFAFEAPWVGTPGSHDIIFNLTMPTGEDLLAGSLEIPAISAPVSSAPRFFDRLMSEPLLWLIGFSGLMLGALSTLLFKGRRQPHEGLPSSLENEEAEIEIPSRKLKRVSGVLTLATCLFLLDAHDGRTAEQAPILPVIPSTMATDMPQRLPDATLFVPKSTQHLISLRTVQTVEAETPRSVELTGTIIPAPDNTSRVQAERPGRLEAPEGGLAYLGRAVKKGDVLGYVAPFMEAFDRATIESQIAETQGRIAQQTVILKRYRERPGAVPQVKVDEVEGELDALIKRRNELLPSRAQRDEIRAPIDGVVSVANVSIGQVVEVRDILFEIINPSEFWVEAVAYDPTVMDSFDSAVVATGDSKARALEFVGKGLILRQQATPLTFRFPKAPLGVAIGKPVKVIIRSTSKAQGYILPAASIVRAPSGLPIVWIKVEPERFEPHPVKYQPVDGGNVLVTSGLKPDQRVVSDGVTLINQIR